jgi:phytoene synthase
MLQPLPDGVHASPADLAVCRQLIREGSKTFFAASQLLPVKVRDAARSLYGFCRVADDLVDQSGNIDDAVAMLRARLDRMYGGHSLAEPADRAFADVAAEFSIPRVLPESLIEGFAWDAMVRRYDTQDDLIAYAVRVAGTVGAMMAIIMNRRNADAVARACDLGIAMQLTNIARDIGDDARLGRIYMPQQWLKEAGIESEEWLAKPAHTDAWASLVRRLLRLADVFYDRAAPGIEILPRRSRPAIRAARLMYREIGRKIERNGCNSIDQRAVVSKLRKAALLGRAFTAQTSESELTLPAAPEAQFIVDAVVSSPAPSMPRQGFDARAAWVINLFMRLNANRS